MRMNEMDLLYARFCKGRNSMSWTSSDFPEVPSRSILQSFKYAHRTCVQHWCNGKGDITCEICHQQYQPGYTAPPRTVVEETIIDIGGGWQISDTPLDLHDPRLLTISEAERQLLEADYDEYNSANASGAAFCRSAALIPLTIKFRVFKSIST